MKPIDWASLPEPPRVVTLDDVLEMPVLPGPGSASPSAVPNPYDLSGGGSALEPGLGLAETLSWATNTSDTEVAPLLDLSLAKHPFSLPKTLRLMSSARPKR